MKKIASLVTALAALALAGQVRADSLVGEQIKAEIGINLTDTDPFAPGFISQIDFGTQTVGAGQEWTSAFGANFDFDANTLSASFGSSHSDLPFNGFRFTLANPFLVITNISVLLDPSNSFGSTWSYVIDPAGHGFGIDLNGQTGMSISLQIDTATVPEGGSTIALLGLTMLGFLRFRRGMVRA